MRINRYLSDSGYCSRREADRLIAQGRVKINGQIAQLGQTVKAGDRVQADGQELSAGGRKVYLLLNKPRGIVCTADPREKYNVVDYLNYPERVFPVGRLDKDTSGLLLLTNDGNFAHRVISPKSEVEKLYYAKVDGLPDLSDCEAFQQGLILADGTRCLPARLELLGGNECYVVVMEGKYHQVKRMLASRGKPVLALRRLAVGGLSLDSALSPGGFRELTETDLCRVFMGR